MPVLAFFIIAFGLSAPIPLAAQRDTLADHPIDRELSECMGTPEGQSTFGTIDCIRTAAEQWDRELNAAYTNLMKILAPKERTMLKTAQKQWLAWRDRELEFSATMYYGLEGSMWKVMAADRAYQIVRRRALELASYRIDKENSD